MKLRVVSWEEDDEARGGIEGGLARNLWRIVLALLVAKYDAGGELMMKMEV